MIFDSFLNLVKNILNHGIKLITDRNDISEQWDQHLCMGRKKLATIFHSSRSSIQSFISWDKISYVMNAINCLYENQSSIIIILLLNNNVISCVRFIQLFFEFWKYSHSPDFADQFFAAISLILNPFFCSSLWTPIFYVWWTEFLF